MTRFEFGANPERQYQEFIAEAKTLVEDLGKETFTFPVLDEDSGDELISATVTGHKALVDISIHVLAKRRLDNLSLGEAIGRAINGAEKMAESRKLEIMSGIQVFGLSVQEMMNDPKAALQRFTDSDVLEAMGLRTE